jgi:SOS-response transcriptional repressor LexA
VKMELTSGSLAVYECIERRYCLEGQSPSIMAIMADLGYASKDTVHHHILWLEAAGWIKRTPKIQHGIVPVRYPRVYYVERKRP